jgi:hypothetical protein
MKKVLSVFAISFILILAAGVFAQTNTLSDDVEKFVKDVAQTKGVNPSQVEGVKQVDFNELPEQIKLENIDNTNLALYELSVKNDQKPLYVITASETQFEKTIEKFTKKMLLNFGSNKEISIPTYLETSTGVQNSKEKGYVMMRDGSITGLSTNLEITDPEENKSIEIVIYKNKEVVGFRNTFSAEKTGVQNDYDTLSENLLKFQAGDVISIAIIVPEGAKVKDITTLMEISTE